MEKDIDDEYIIVQKENCLLILHLKLSSVDSYIIATCIILLSSADGYAVGCLQYTADTYIAECYRQ